MRNEALRNTAYERNETHDTYEFKTADIVRRVEEHDQRIDYYNFEAADATGYTEDTVYAVIRDHDDPILSRDCHLSSVSLPNEKDPEYRYLDRRHNAHEIRGLSRIT